MPAPPVPLDTQVVEPNTAPFAGVFDEVSMQLGRILLSKEMRKRAGGMSRMTEWRLHQRGEGPPRVRINGRDWGYPENLFEQWLISRLERPLENA
jgi:predicted DNA-binding transcriptional regulator AlpA